MKNKTVRHFVWAGTIAAIMAVMIILTGCGSRNGNDPDTLPTFAPPFTPPTELPPLAQSPPTLTVDNLRDFPSLHFTTQVDPFGVARTLWHDAELAINGVQVAYALENTAVRLRGRGNSTWLHGPEKRPLRIRFAEPTAVLDATHAARDWVLIANLFDMTLMRTHLAFVLGDRLGTFPWVPYSQLVHVYINGEYQGVFQLADERDVHPARADLHFNTNPAYSGFLLEIDGSAPSRQRRLDDGEVEGVDFIFVNGWVIDVRYPRLNQRDNHLDYLRDYLYTVDTAIHAGDFAALQHLADIPSMVDFYLVQEWFKDIDGGDRSIFMQLMGTGETRRLYFGPLWDFDRSAGNLAYWNTPEHIFIGHYNAWFAALMDMAEFRALVTARWQEIRHGAVKQTLAYAQYLLDHYEVAFDRNFARHDHIFDRTQGEPDWFWLVPEVVRELDSFRAQVEHMMGWLYARALWLDGIFLPEI